MVHVKEKNTRFRDVLQDDSIGIAKSEASGSDIGARRDVSDMAQAGMARMPKAVRLVVMCSDRDAV